MSWVVGALLVAWFSARYAWWRPPVPNDRPRILMYHMISEARTGQQFKGLRVAPSMFERQLRWLQRHGWRFVTLSELQAGHFKGDKLVALTFDDGYEDNYLNALPLMRRYRAKGTLYLVGDRHRRDWSVQRKAHHDSGELATENKLTDDQVTELIRSGLFELGGHTSSHCNLGTAGLAEKRREIVDHRHQLEKDFGTTVTSFAYPFGIYADDDVQLVKDAGYTTAVTTVEGIDAAPDPWQLKRIKVSGKDSFLAFVIRMRTGKRGWR